MTTDPGAKAQILTALRHNAMLRGASEESIETLASAARLLRFGKGERILCEGESIETFGVMIEGRARAVHYDADGHETTFLTLWPSEAIGARHGLGGHPIPFDVCAEENVLIAMIPLSRLKELLLAEPQTALAVIEDLSAQLVSLVDMAKTLRLGVSDRVLYYVSRLPSTPISANSFQVTLPTSRVELASFLGTSPETLSRAFQSLGKSGLLEASGAEVTVLDARALWERVGE